MVKKKSYRTVTRHWKVAVAILVALALGFVGGMMYTHSSTTTTYTQTSPGNPLYKVCNCPNIPVGQNPADYCKC